MLRRKHEESSPVKRIRTGGKDRYLLIRTIYRKIHFCAIASADPVRLHLLDLFGPVQLVQIVQKSVCISSDFQHPLLQILLGHFRAAALTLAIYHFFVCKARFTGRTPVDRHFLLIGETFLKHLYKDPLRPFKEFRICGI